MLIAFTEQLDSNLSRAVEAYSPIAEKLSLPSLDHLTGVQQLVLTVVGAIILTGFIEAVFKPAAIWLTQRLLLDRIGFIWDKINNRIPHSIKSGSDLNEVYHAILWDAMKERYGNMPKPLQRLAIASLKAEYSPDINARVIRGQQALQEIVGPLGGKKG